MTMEVAIILWCLGAVVLGYPVGKYLHNRRTAIIRRIILNSFREVQVDRPWKEVERMEYHNRCLVNGIEKYMKLDENGRQYVNRVVYELINEGAIYDA